MTFNAGTGGVDGTYATGDSIVATVNYVADTPSVTANDFTLTTTVTNSAGSVTAQTSSPFVVNTTNPSGDVLSGSDTDAAGAASRTWTAGAAAVQSDGSLDQTLSATA